MGDNDGDGKPELLVWAGLDDSIGKDLGRAWLVPSKAGSKPKGLDMPGKSSGARMGHHVRFVGDLNGDGFADLAVGAPYDPANKAAAGDPPVYTGTRTGQVYVYAGTATGVSPQSL